MQWTHPRRGLARPGGALAGLPLRDLRGAVLERLLPHTGGLPGGRFYIAQVTGPDSSAWNVTLNDTASGHQGMTVVAGPRIILGVTTNDPLWATPLDTSTGCRSAPSSPNVPSPPRQPASR